MRAALNEAGIGPEDLDHINAQGFSSPEADVWEARGLQDLLADTGLTVPVFAGKSYFGSLSAGSSTTELAASILALENGVLPPTLNYEDPDPSCPIHVAAKECRPVTRKNVLKLSFTEMGQCGAVVLRKW
jgi:3-oxoacyl-[acyl-carrier-protein] synthase II